MRQWISGWRGLGVFWAAVLLVLGAGAATLAMLGAPAPPPQAAAPVLYHGNNTAWPGPPARPMTAPRIGAPIHGPDAALMEAAPDFPNAHLPRIGPGQRRPAEVYAAFAGSSRAGTRLALVIAGIGLDHADSLAAIRALPEAVDLAVSAYAASPAMVLEAARASGHELLLSLPMEPAGYPDADEGSHQLLTSATPPENARNLEWALSRIDGYAGVTGASDGQAGERYAASPALMAGVAAELARRGLFYLDPRPGAPPLPGTQSRAVDAVIADQDAIDTRLGELEQQARAQGSAIGLVNRPTPVVVAHLSAWIAGLASRGVTLVPAASLIVRRASP